MLKKGTSFLLVYYGNDGSGGWQPLDRPLRTITTVDRFALVEHDGDMWRMRMLQVPELRRAMGHENDFQMPVGTRRDRIKLLGNGVCPARDGVRGSVAYLRGLSGRSRFSRIGAERPRSTPALISCQTTSSPGGAPWL